MKILHINSYYNSGSFYKNIFDYQKSFNEIKVYVHLSRKDKINIDDDCCVFGRPYTDIEKYFFFYKHRKIIKDLKSKINVNSFDIIHAHSLFSNGFEAYKIYKTTDIPYVVSVRNTDVNIFLKRAFFLRPLAIKILLNAKAIVFLSSTYLQYVADNYVPKKYKAIFIKKANVITNGVDSFWINNINNHNKSKNQINVITTAVINKNKNQTTVCKALDILKKRGYQVSYNLYGRIADKSVLKKVKSYSFAHVFKPEQKEELLKKYRENDVFVMPSINETFGLSYVEAMTQGLPVIYSKGQGFDGQFNDGVIGYSVNSLDYNLLAGRIEKCYLEFDALSLNCTKESLRYNWQSINKKLLALYS